MLPLKKAELSIHEVIVFYYKVFNSHHNPVFIACCYAANSTCKTAWMGIY
jgi:hypothetical protein